MLFLIGLFLRNTILAKTIHWVALLGILLGIWQFSKSRISQNDFPFLSMLIFLSIPSVFIVSHMAYVDLFITYYSLAAVLAFLRWHEERSPGWLALSGIFSGLALSSKYTALLLPLLGCFGIFWSFYRDRVSWRPVMRSLFLYLAFTVLLGSPFYLKNWIMTGNPFYPFFYEIFGGRGWDTDQARLYDYFVSILGRGRGFWDYLLLPWNISLRAKIGSPEFDGLLGPIFLLTLPFLIGIRRIQIPTKIISGYCIFTFLFWASSAQQIRYLIPVFPLLSILVGYILTRYEQKKVFLPILYCLILGSMAFNGFYMIRDFLEIKPIGVVIGTEDRDSFLRRRLPSYDIINYINNNVPERSRLFLIYMKNRGFLLDRDYYSDSMFESYTIQKILTRSLSTEDVYAVLRDKGFTHVLYDLNYISGNLSTFSPEEKEKFFDFQKKYLTLQKNKGPYYLFRLR